MQTFSFFFKVLSLTWRPPALMLGTTVDSAPFIPASSDWEAEAGWALAAKTLLQLLSISRPPRPVAAARLRFPPSSLLFVWVVFVGSVFLLLWACKAPSDTETRLLRRHGRKGYLYFTNALYIYSSLVWDWRGATRVRRNKNNNNKKPLLTTQVTGLWRYSA